MRFIECPALTRLCALLHNLDVGDRIVRGRLELLTTAEDTAQEQSLLAIIENELTSSPLFAASSPPPLLLSPLSSSSSNGGSSTTRSSGKSRQRLQDPRHTNAKGRQLLVNLISTLNQCFPDYEFSSTLTPAMFREEPSLSSVQADINQKLRSVEMVLPGFTVQLWNAIESAVCLSSCAVYSHETGESEDPTPLISLFAPVGAAPAAPGVCLSSFFYFFVDRQRNRLLFFGSGSSCKLSSPSWLGALEGAEVDAADDADEVHIGEVYGADAPAQVEPEAAEEADSLSDLELPSSACAYA
ncbi:hypothetical protein, conserved [Eimeria acervulina]|uniref:Repressor of RNA polymerase III transcription n=1 Tax=Eimeria acervulina TaxID=5801 RepID=U6GU62_EIMAC|nr:hypothetical protein, conserved [Eimeria acervulina]CDI83806.1 hypothetical protein, conserved [Eimeria acervulina]